MALYRSPVNPPDLKGPQYVIALGEPSSRETVAYAGRIIAGSGGREVALSEEEVAPYVARRVRLLLANAMGEAPEKWEVRNPMGQVMSSDGRNLGPFKRPQG